jgi:hypothetical protein
LLIGRFVSADTLVPDGDKASIVPLTVDFHELQLLAQLNAENRYTLEHGFWFQLSAREKHEAKVQRGPPNPQALNRFSYALGNPLKYTDPSGHDTICNDDFTVCTGAVVINNSSRDIFVRGDMLTADGVLLQGYVFRLKAGESSKDLGIVDVDEIIISPDDPDDAHSRHEFRRARISDGTTIELEEGADGEISLPGYSWEQYQGSTIPERALGNSRISGTEFVSGGRIGAGIALYIARRVQEYSCKSVCEVYTPFFKGR